MLNLRRFPRKCAGCAQVVAPNELVMRARHLLFHLGCFKCFACERQLNTGDEFGLSKEGSVLCRTHYFFSIHPGESSKCLEANNNTNFDQTYSSIEPNSNSHFDPNNYFYNMCNMPPTPGISPPNSATANNLIVPAPSFFSTQQQQQQQNPSTLISPQSQSNTKGRPKKRKAAENSISPSAKKSNKAHNNNKATIDKPTNSPQSILDQSSSSTPPLLSLKKTDPSVNAAPLDSPSDDFKQFDSTLGKSHVNHFKSFTARNNKKNDLKKKFFF